MNVAASPCQFCNRKFAPSRIEAHEYYCQASSEKKKTRLESVVKSNSPVKQCDILSSQWRQAREELSNTITLTKLTAAACQTHDKDSLDKLKELCDKCPNSHIISCGQDHEIGVFDDQGSIVQIPPTFFSAHSTSVPDLLDASTNYIKELKSKKQQRDSRDRSTSKSRSKSSSGKQSKTTSRSVSRSNKKIIPVDEKSKTRSESKSKRSDEKISRETSKTRSREHSKETSNSATRRAVHIVQDYKKHVEMVKMESVLSRNASQDRIKNDHRNKLNPDQAFEKYKNTARLCNPFS